MNIALWIVQGLLAFGLAMVGFTHAFRRDRLAERPRMDWVKAVDPRLMTFIGFCEMLGALGMILPGVTGSLPWLTPLAGALLVVMMLLAAGFHVQRKEYQNIQGNLIILALAAFVAVGRFFLAPLA